MISETFALVIIFLFSVVALIIFSGRKSSGNDLGEDSKDAGRKRSQAKTTKKKIEEVANMAVALIKLLGKIL